MKPGLTIQKAIRVLMMVLILPLATNADDGDLIWPYELEIENPENLLSDKDGGAVVVWSTTGSPDEIRAQRYDDGSSLWGTDGKLVSDTTDAIYPAATEDMFGGVVVTYASGVNIYAQRLNANGNKVWNGGNGVLVLAGVNPSEDPIITPDGAGGAYIGYRRKINHIQNDGTVANTSGYEFVMSAGVERFSMVCDGQRSLIPNPWRWVPGGVFLAWFSSSTLNIHAQHVNAGPQWGDTVTMHGTLVSTAYTHISISHQRLYRVMHDGSGGLIVAWSGWSGYPNTGTGQVRAQCLDTNGNRLWGNDGVPVVDSSTAGGNTLTWWNQLMPPELSTDGAGGAILAWNDMRNTNNYPGDIDIYCQRVNAGGSVQWQTNGNWVTWPGDTTGQTPPNSGTESNPAMVSDGNGGVVIAVQDYYQSQNIYTNRIDGNGVTMWTKWPVWDDYSGGYGDQKWPQIIFDGTGLTPKGAIVAWQETGGSVGDSAQKIEVSDTPPDNDNIADARTLWTCGSNQCSLTGSLYWATNDGSTSCGGTTQPDVWYKFTAPDDGVLDINTCGTNDLFGVVDRGLDTVLSVHSDSPGTTGNELDCNDDAEDGSCAGQDTGSLRDSSLTHSLNSGKTVYVRVSRYCSTYNGMFKLGWQFTTLFFGDVNGDDDVDGTDLSDLAGEFGTSCGSSCIADFNSDGQVNEADLALYAGNFGKINSP